MAGQNVQLRLDMDTREAERRSKRFWNGFAQLARASASAANSGNARLGARQIGGGVGSTLASTFFGPVVGEVSAGVLGVAERVGTAAFKPVINAFSPLVARNAVQDKLAPIAEAQAIATGTIDKEGLRQIGSVYQQIETRRRKGRTELAAMMGEDDIENLGGLLKDVLVALKEAITGGTFGR